jgi:hypothetical protein
MPTEVRILLLPPRTNQPITLALMLAANAVGMLAGFFIDSAPA